MFTYTIAYHLMGNACMTDTFKTNNIQDVFDKHRETKEAVEKLGGNNVHVILHIEEVGA